MKELNNVSRMLSSKKASRALHISKSTLYKMIESGELDAAKDERGFWRVNISSLQGLQDSEQCDAEDMDDEDEHGSPIELYTLEQCQEILKLGRSTVLKLLYSGELHGIKVKGMWRVTRKEMKRYLRGRMSCDCKIW